MVLVARSRDRLSETADLLAGATGVNVEVLVADLSTTEGADAVAARVADPDRPVDLLVNNAGMGLTAGFLETSIEEEVAALDVMVRAVLVLSHAAASAMASRGHGAILNVSSVAGWLGNGSYAAHKAWVTSFTEGLASQLKGTGVTATAVLPGLTHTEFHERAELEDYEDLPEIAWLVPEQVVASALAAVRRKQVLVTPVCPIRGHDLGRTGAAAHVGARHRKQEWSALTETCGAPRRARVRAPVRWRP